MTDFLVRGSLEELDPKVFELTQIEAERQVRKLIMIASESQAPIAVRDGLGSVFQNIYAEGYPDEASRWMSEDEILDHDERLLHYRRYSDPRYYKGVEYADMIESLARRRAAEAFAANGVTADEIYVNIQALSGGPANNAVYHALVQPGDTVMGMDLLHGGHLSHGSHVNRSGKNYNIISYGIDDETEQIDYEVIRALALEHKPKMIIAGFSSYSWVPDWKKFREIADEVGAYLLTDISHIGGLTAAGVVPSPMGIADVIMSTTHKSLHGPRGAVLMTTNRLISRKLDRAVFPGEQGGPHVNTFVGLALAFKLAKTEDYKNLQQKTIDNAIAMVDQFQKRGLKVPFGGTDTHLINIDCSSIKGADGSTLSGDMASRILDVAGLVVNRNTIPGDRSALAPSGIRLGTPWITQRGFDEAKSRELADVISDVLLGCQPYFMDVPKKRKRQRRANIDFALLNDAKLRIRELALSAGMDFEPISSGYPHFYYLDDKVNAKDGWAAYDLKGKQIRQTLDYTLSADLSALKDGESVATCVHTPEKIVKGSLTRVTSEAYRLSVPEADANLASTWLRDLSDGYVSLNVEKSADFAASRVPGPFVVSESDTAPVQRDGKDEKESDKAFYVGIGQLEVKSRAALPDFKWDEPADPPLQRTPIFEAHKALGGKLIPFAGWEMPVWYSGVMEEHLATRKAAGLFDVAHMGVYDVRGDDAASFLDTVCGNDVGGLADGNSLYTQFLTPDAAVIDDTLVYRRGRDNFLVVVNASNDDKDRTWLESVRDGKVKIDNKYPWARTYGYDAEIRNLRDPKVGDAMKVDIALQGPRSRDVLLAMGVSDEHRARIMGLKRTQLCDATVGGFDLIVSRTGYTGEKMAFELFVHPERAAEFWMAVLKAGEQFGVKPIGLGARDSLRTEFGLPLYGHEMGLGSGQLGQADLGVAEGGFGSYVKTYKPYFIGRDAYIANEKKRKGVVARFTFTEKGVRMAHNGDPVMDKRGKVIGWVTSCAADMNGTLTGQAYLPLKFAKKDTPIFIYQSAPKKAGVAPAEMKVGNKATLPSAAVVVTRFAKL
ncbi:MAG: serine hydroxymethyltransferase [Anaerolineae bacterium]|nr:serine hydroxymethyltransferase [Anaerolineae bacterium]MBT7326090.1 serine hydroxymethyltransferase [Anaerolineae bacterium]